MAISAHLRLDRFPALITAPAHLVPQWVDQLELWGVPPSEISATPRGSSPHERIEALFADTAFRVVSYEMWTTDRYRQYLLDSEYAAYTFDEFHRLRRGGRRRRRSKEGGAYKAVRWLRTKTRSSHLRTPVWALTGTPIVRDATDVFPFLQLANPYRYTSRNRFAVETCLVADTPYGLHIGKVRDPRHFHKQLARYSVRRGWSSIPALRDLEVRHIELPVILDKSAYTRHRVIKKDYRDPVTGEPLFSSAAMIRALRQVSMPAKLDALSGILEDHPGRWFLLAWYRHSARQVQALVERTGRPVGYIDGSVPEDERQAALRTYKANRGGVLVATIASTREGLDGLQIGNQVGFVEQHYLSEENAQAWQRLYRRGQGHPVLAYWFYARRSFDMRVRRIAHNRGIGIEEALAEFLEEVE